jgi:hypothetical protein
MAFRLPEFDRDPGIKTLISLSPHYIDAQRPDNVQLADIRRTATRLSRFQSKAWNRQSIHIFADFNTFDSPHGSRSQRAAERNDEEHDVQEAITPPELERARSSASNIYSLDKPLPEPPYHVFTLVKKKQLVYIVSAAAIFSLLSSKIYFPALGQISKVYYLLRLDLFS